MSLQASLQVRTETWLNPDIYNNETFPQNYQIFREDRADGYGDVFFACHNTINCTQIPLQTQCEAISRKINLTDGLVLIELEIYNYAKYM